jgi:hypothetical protein
VDGDAVTITVIVHPEPPENQKPLAQELLALADKPSDVEFVMWPEPGFRIPEDLFAKFLRARTKVENPPEDTEPVEPVKRKPGRPKKEGQ